jgi:1,2-diacylglycerol 3-alpha-glucosyltransferase
MQTHPKSSREPADPVHVGFVSTFPPMRCAIGIYTQKLGDALGTLGTVTPFVVAEDGGEQEALPGGSVPVRRAYRRNTDYRDAVYDALLASGSRVAHFQYAPDLFGEDQRLPSLVARLDRAGVRPIVTLHTVYGARPWRVLTRRPTTEAFHRGLAEHAHLVVHHADGMKTELVRQGVPSLAISVIPHGTTVVAPAPPAPARQRLGLAEEPFYFTFFGFIHRYKNVHVAVEGFLRAAPHMPRARLLVVGMPWGDRWYNHLYVNAIRARLGVSRYGSRVEIRDEYVAPALVPDVYAASDVILLPHRQSYGSASGVFHQAVGYGRPVLAAQGPKFVEARSLFRDLPELTVPPRHAELWARAMRRIYESPALREGARAAVAEFAERTSWPRVAEQHAALYRKLAAERP